MIVNLPNWTNIANNSEPWFSGTLNTFLPAGYLEIGIVVGVGMILFILALVSGAARSILGSLGKGSDPLRGIGSGNYSTSSFGHLRNNFSSNYGRVGSIGAVNARMARWGNLEKRKSEQKLDRENEYLARIETRQKAKEDQKWSGGSDSPSYKLWKEPE